MFENIVKILTKTNFNYGKCGSLEASSLCSIIVANIWLLFKYVNCLDCLIAAGNDKDHIMTLSGDVLWPEIKAHIVMSSWDLWDLMIKQSALGVQLCGADMHRWKMCCGSVIRSELCPMPILIIFQIHSLSHMGRLQDTVQHNACRKKQCEMF